MIFELENKNVHASDAGQELDHKKETIIFLHGSGLTHIVWSLVEQFFSNKKFNVLSIDLPGHGNSDGPCLNSIENIADWLEKVFVKLKLDKVILVGHSQGCLEMLEYSNKYKSRLQKLVFMGGSYKMPVNQDLIDLAENGDPDAVKVFEDEISKSAEKEVQFGTIDIRNGVWITVLGNVQDGGSPHIGCEKNCCKDLFQSPDKERKVSSLGVIDYKFNRSYIFDATPDFTSQLEYLNNKMSVGSKLLDGIFLTHAHIGHYTGLMYLGFEHSTRSGSSIGVDDFVIPDEKPTIIDAAEKEVKSIETQYESGLVTQGERYNKVIDISTILANKIIEYTPIFKNKDIMIKKNIPPHLTTNWTEKDFVRLRGLSNTSQCYYLPIKTKMFDQDNFKATLKSYFKV